ncbi:hypothetical protein [Streptomyces sp. NPDC005322]|uniref:hypothetical protein n=1 Tax=unclassified Streptomyces TaxID=2593676 RepID=UPI0033A6CE9A
MSASASARMCAWGTHLARVQMRAMLRAALDRLPGLRRAGEPVRLTSNFQNGLKTLPVRWETGR